MRAFQLNAISLRFSAGWPQMNCEKLSKLSKNRASRNPALSGGALEIQSAIPKDYKRSNEINCRNEDWNTAQLKERSMSLSRRAFIENSAVLIAAIGVSDAAWPASAPMLSESDPTAMALGYKADASTVDKS